MHQNPLLGVLDIIDPRPLQRWVKALTEARLAQPLFVTCDLNALANRFVDRLDALRAHSHYSVMERGDGVGMRFV